MFKTIKKHAKKTLVNNYKHFIVPSLLFILSNIIVYLIINIITSVTVWSSLNFVSKTLSMFLLFIAVFIIYPTSIGMILKLSIVLRTENTNDSEKKVKQIFSVSNICKIFAINFIPRIFYLFFEIVSSKVSCLNIFNVDNKFVAIIWMLSECILYKLFLSNYYFILKETTVRDALMVSFNTMKGVFGKYLLWRLAFIGWIFLIAIVYLLFGMIFYSNLADSSHSTILRILLSTGFGINFYLIPYMYFSKSLFADELLNSKLKKENVGR